MSVTCSDQSQEKPVIDLDHLRTWIGKTQCDEDRISARQAQLMAATVDYPEPQRLRDGAALPPLWHWIYFLEGRPAAQLGRCRARACLRRAAAPSGAGPVGAAASGAFRVPVRHPCSRRYRRPAGHGARRIGKRPGRPPVWRFAVAYPWVLFASS